MADYQSLIEHKLSPVGKSNEDIIYRCPQCEGEKGSGHLYVNYNKEMWHCFKCNAGGKRLESLLKMLNIEVSYDYSKLYSEYDESLDKVLELNKKKIEPLPVEYSNNLSTLTQYYNLHTSDLSPRAFNYLVDRGVSPSIIKNLDMREGVNRFGEIFNLGGIDYIGRDYSGRIMIPSKRKDGLISFYVGRDFIGDKKAKYLNAPKELASASEDVWSLDIIDSPYVIICEGVFTAISVNQALDKIVTCATYGKSIAHRSSSSSVIASSQGDKLLDRKFTQYIVFYDKDAYLDAYNTAKYLYDRGANVRVVNISTDKYGEKADAADMTKEEVIEHIKNSVEFSNFYGIL